MNSGEIKDYGNGILWFDCYGDKFGNTLSKYRSEHPELRVVSIAQERMYEFTGSYFVIVEKVKT